MLKMLGKEGIFVYFVTETDYFNIIHIHSEGDRSERERERGSERERERKQLI